MNIKPHVSLPWVSGYKPQWLSSALVWARGGDTKPTWVRLLAKLPVCGTPLRHTHPQSVVSVCFQCCRAPKRGKSLGKWKICISSWRTWGHNKPDIGVVSHGRLVVCTVINLGSTGQPGKTAPCLSFGIPKWDVPMSLFYLCSCHYIFMWCHTSSHLPSALNSQSIKPQSISPQPQQYALLHHLLGSFYSKEIFLSGRGTETYWSTDFDVKLADHIQHPQSFSVAEYPTFTVA